MLYRAVFLDEKYPRLAQTHSEQYQKADPFPHIVFDDFLPPDICGQVLAEVEAGSTAGYQRFNDPTGVKLGSIGTDPFGPATRMLIDQFNAGPFLMFLQTLTGINHPLPDPFFEKGTGGGIHQIPSGGFLKIHADFTRHPKLDLERRLNVLVYLNQDWPEEYGGHLELWDSTMTRCTQRILPVFNRCVIFNTDDNSYHGHPAPIQCPPDRLRRSLALYYYTPSREQVVRQLATTEYHLSPEELAKTRRLGFRLQSAASTVIGHVASVAHQPSKWLRLLSDRLRPRV